MKKQQLWRWNWKSGGWNQCFAFTKEEAISIAKQKGVGVLIVIEESMHVVKPSDFFLRK